jgi:Xaa-Pro aminopeptidase
LSAASSGRANSPSEPFACAEITVARVYYPHFGGIRIEDIVAGTKDGYEIARGAMMRNRKAV